MFARVTLANARASDTNAMFESFQELRDSYDDLKKRVEQLGRFL